MTDFSTKTANNPRLPRRRFVVKFLSTSFDSEAPYSVRIRVSQPDPAMVRQPLFERGGARNVGDFRACHARPASGTRSAGQKNRHPLHRCSSAPYCSPRESRAPYPGEEPTEMARAENASTLESVSFHPILPEFDRLVIPAMCRFSGVPASPIAGRLQTARQGGGEKVELRERVPRAPTFAGAMVFARILQRAGHPDA